MFGTEQILKGYRSVSPGERSVQSVRSGKHRAGFTEHRFTHDVPSLLGTDWVRSATGPVWSDRTVSVRFHGDRTYSVRFNGNRIRFGPGWTFCFHNSVRTERKHKFLRFWMPIRTEQNLMKELFNSSLDLFKADQFGQSWSGLFMVRTASEGLHRFDTNWTSVQVPPSTDRASVPFGTEPNISSGSWTFRYLVYRTNIHFVLNTV